MPYIIGIDLGTTNCALRPSTQTVETAAGEQFRIPQLTNPGEVRAESLLPSFLYMPGPTDFRRDHWPCRGTKAPVASQDSSRRSAAPRMPDGWLSSAKSWLSHAGVDRTAALLPLTAPEGVGKISPRRRIAGVSRHLREAWDQRAPRRQFEQQTVLVTVPASFDAVARELTLHAAKQAGYQNVILLEEPQAAFYAWIERNPNWREQVTVGDLILVVDIGGGTTDFTLIAVTESGGELPLERVAVGEHILLGGDNMDLALARVVERAARRAKAPSSTPCSFNALWQQCRAAKGAAARPEAKAQRAPGHDSGPRHRPGRRTIKAQAVTRDDIDQILLEGFLPAVSQPPTCRRRSRRADLQEIGLPYAADAAITRHLAQIPAPAGRYANTGVRRASGLLPTHVLFNGGVLQAPDSSRAPRRRSERWLADEGMPPSSCLTGDDLMHAVARGAAYYGLARAGQGRAHPRRRAAGLLRRHRNRDARRARPSRADEGADRRAVRHGRRHRPRQLPEREFGLVVGEPAEFRFFTSAARKNDDAGDHARRVRRRARRALRRWR